MFYYHCYHYSTATTTCCCCCFSCVFDALRHCLHSQHPCSFQIGFKRLLYTRSFLFNKIQAGTLSRIPICPGCSLHTVIESVPLWSLRVTPHRSVCYFGDVTKQRGKSTPISLHHSLSLPLYVSFVLNLDSFHPSPFQTLWYTDWKGTGPNTLNVSWHYTSPLKAQTNYITML